MNKEDTKKINLLINSLRGGGAERVCVTIANELANRGWDVTLVVLNLREATYQNSLNKTIKLEVLNKKHARFALGALRKLVARDNTKCFVVFNHQLAIILLLLRMLSRKKYNIISRNISTLTSKRKNEKSFWHKNVAHWVTRFFYRRVDHVIAQSAAMKTDLLRNYGFSETQVSVIHNPLGKEFEAHSKENTHSGIKAKKDFLLCIGRLHPVKAFHKTISALGKLQDDFPSLRLKIVGDGELKPYLEKYAQREGVEGKVDFEGFQTNVIPYYLHAKATVLTSLYEGFPNVLIESIALGTPVVAFNCPSGPSEIIIDGVNGYLVRNDDIDHLTECLKKTLLKEWDTGKIVGSAKRYQLKTIIGEYEDVISRYV